MTALGAPCETRRACRPRSNLSGCAVAALKTIMFDKCSLHRVQAALLSETFDRDDFSSLILDGEREAGIDAFAVH